jgi:hypothetical protein
VTTYPKGIIINGHRVIKLETFRARVSRHRGAGGVKQDFKKKKQEGERGKGIRVAIKSKQGLKHSHYYLSKLVSPYLYHTPA